MKTKILSTLLLTLSPAVITTDPVAKAQFEKSDAIINKYLDQLESPNTTIEEKTKYLM